MGGDNPLARRPPPAELLRRHGDGVCDVAFQVDDATRAFALAVERGARPALPPQALQDDHGVVRRAAIHTYGHVVHSFLSYDGYDGPFLPDFMALDGEGGATGLLLVDHIVGNVEHMQEWADYYARVMGFSRYMTFDDNDISTEYSALMSIVMAA